MSDNTVISLTFEHLKPRKYNIILFDSMSNKNQTNLTKNLQKINIFVTVPSLKWSNYKLLLIQIYFKFIFSPFFYIFYIIIQMYLIIIGVYVALVLILQLKKYRQGGSKKAKKIAFFHPFCNDGGGGQKVLWSLIQALLQQIPPQANAKQYENAPIINVYSLQQNSHQILTKVSGRFNIKLSDYSHRINFIHVKGRGYLLPKSKFTMICHIFLPMIYCFKCIWKYQPDIFYDTTGFAFNFLLVKLLLPFTQCWAYVHYPFISEDMVAKIRERRADYNNDASISQSPWKSKLKIIYYNVILLTYKLVRFIVKNAQANSSWTQGHMVKLWGPLIKKLYPPCSMEQLLKYQKNYDTSEIKIVSLAQFRPEKNHALQINVVNNLVKRLKQKTPDLKLKLFICGTTRGADDEKLLESLRGKVQLLKLQEYITFCVNMKFPELLGKMKQSNYGIHSMEAEHFGISVVEMLAAGCLIVAHNSAGPKLDIIKDERFLAQSEKQYEQKLLKIFQMSTKEKKQIANQNRKRMKQFGQINFKQNFRAIFYAQNPKTK